MTRLIATAAIACALTLSACSVEENELLGEAQVATSVATVETFTAAQLAAMVEAGEVLLVDVRTPAEFAEARIPGALNAPLSTFDPAAIPMEEGRETILYCRSSHRSGQAAEMLSEFTQGTIHHLEGGIMAWEEAGLETVAEPAPAPPATPST